MVYRRIEFYHNKSLDTTRMKLLLQNIKNIKIDVNTLLRIGFCRFLHASACFLIQRVHIVGEDTVTQVIKRYKEAILDQ